MKVLYDIKDKVCKMLENIGQKGPLTGSDLEAVNLMTSILKNIHKLTEGSQGASHNGFWQADVRGGYGPNSYASQGPHSYTGESMRGGSYDGYSHHGDEVFREMEELMRRVGDKEREVLRRAMQEMKR